MTKRSAFVSPLENVVSFHSRRPPFMCGFIQAAQATKSRVWGDNPNKIPSGQNQRPRKIWYCNKILLLETVGLRCVGLCRFPLHGGDSPAYAAVFSLAHEQNYPKTGTKKNRKPFYDFLFRNLTSKKYPAQATHVISISSHEK